MGCVSPSTTYNIHNRRLLKKLYMLKLACVRACGNPRGCLNNHIFSNFGLCAAHWARFTCHRVSCPTSVNQPFCFLNSSQVLRTKTLPVNYYLFSGLFLTILLFQIAFPIFCAWLLLYPPYPKDRGMLWFYVEAARRPPPAARHPPPAARSGVNAITQKPRDGLFSNLVYTLVVIVSWPD